MCGSEMQKLEKLKQMKVNTDKNQCMTINVAVILNTPPNWMLVGVEKGAGGGKSRPVDAEKTKCGGPPAAQRGCLRKQSYRQTSECSQ